MTGNQIFHGREIAVGTLFFSFAYHTIYQEKAGL